MVRREAAARSKQGTKRSQSPIAPPIAPLAAAAKRRKTAEPDWPSDLASERASLTVPCRRSAREATKRQTAAADLTAAARQHKGLTVPRPEKSSQQSQQQRRKQQQQQRQKQRPTANVDTKATDTEQQSAVKGHKGNGQSSILVTAHGAGPSANANTTSRGDRSSPRQTDQAEPAVTKAPASRLLPVPAAAPGHDHDHAAANVQPPSTQAEVPTPTSAADNSATSQSAAGHKKRVYGVPHHTFSGVVTTTEGVRAKHAVSQIEQLWSAFITVEKPRTSVRRYIGRFYHSPEAAARAVDRASIAIHGRDSADLNFPQRHYGPEEQQRHGADLEQWLRSLAGRQNNNPKDAPGVPHIKPAAAWLEWRNAHLSGFRAQHRARAQKGKAVANSTSEPAVDPAVGWTVWEMLTGASAKQARPEGQHGGAHWHNTPCGVCVNCKQAAWQNSSLGSSQCLALPKLQMARRELTRLANSSGQQRFQPADLQHFLASLPDPTRADMQARPSTDEQPRNGQRTLTDSQRVKSQAKLGKKRSYIEDLSAVHDEGRDGVRQERVGQAVADSSKDFGKAAEDVRAEYSKAWTREQAWAMQTREEEVYQAQEQDRVLAADAAASQGYYQPLLTSCSAPQLDNKHKWPGHHMADIRHIQRCAREGSLVEVRNHEKWRAPALGTLGPPRDALPGSLGAKSELAYKPQHITHCCLCKAQDHLIKNCPLNRYYDEAPSEGLQAAQSKGRGSGPKAGKDSDRDQQPAAADWLASVQQPVKDVMSAMQQMASAAVQMNEQKDSKHSDLWESMTPDALLACGLLVDELMEAQVEQQPNT